MSFRTDNLIPKADRWARVTPSASNLPSLQDQLRLQNLSISLAISDADRALIERRLGEIRKARVNDTSLHLGDTAPKVMLGDVRLDALLERGPVVLSFYLGDWFPYCALAYRAMCEAGAEFDLLDAQRVSISATPSGDGFVTDANNWIASAFRLAVPFTDDVARIYRELGFHLPESSNPFVAIPATYVIDQRRIIRFAFVNPDYRRRAEPADVLDAVARI